ncbi:hypothetical protein TSOC_000105, partial [Tetrabaena socialis]
QVVARALTSAAAEPAAAEASTSGQAETPGWMGRGFKPSAKKDPFLSWLYMREGADGVKRLMPMSERLIWGTVLGGLGYFIVPRVYKSRINAAEEAEASRKREVELQEKRLTAIRMLMMGKSWVQDEADAFEGLTPKQIAEFIKKNNINPDDPFEGMSPDEIDEFVRKTGVSL